MFEHRKNLSTFYKNISYNYFFYLLFLKNSNNFFITCDDNFYKYNIYVLITNNDLIFLNWEFPINNNLFDIFKQKTSLDGNLVYPIALNIIINTEIICYFKYSKKLVFSFDNFNIHDLFLNFYKQKIKFFYLLKCSDYKLVNNTLKEDFFNFYTNILLELNLFNNEEFVFFFDVFLLAMSTNNINHLVFDKNSNSMSNNNKYNKDQFFKNFYNEYKIYSCVFIIYILYEKKHKYIIEDSDDTRWLKNILKDLQDFNFNSYVGQSFTSKFSNFFFNFFKNKKTYYLFEQIYKNINELCDNEDYTEFYKKLLYFVNILKWKESITVDMYVLLNPYSLKLKYTYLELFFNFEGFFNLNLENSNFLVYTQKNLKENSFLDRQLNYSLSPHIKLNIINLFTTLNLKFLNLSWNNYFEFKNFFLRSNIKLKRNIYNKFNSNLRTNYLKKFNKYIYINYFKKEIPVFKVTESLNNIVKPLLNILNFSWSDISYTKFINNEDFDCFYIFVYSYYNYLYDNKEYFYCIFDPKNIKIKTFSNFLIFLSDFLENFKNNYNNHQILCNLLIKFFNKFYTFLPIVDSLFINSYKNSYKTFNLLLEFKNINKKITFNKFELELKKFINCFKVYTLNLKKNLSSFYNYFTLKSNFIILISTDFWFNYNYYFDFRGRIYVHDISLSWYSNYQLRNFISINQNKIIFKKIENNFMLTDQEEEKILIKAFLLKHFNLELNNFQIKNLVENFIYTYGKILGHLLKKCLDNKQAIILGLDLFNKDLNYLESLSLDLYNKFLIFKSHLIEINLIYSTCFSNSNEELNMIYKFNKIFELLKNLTISIDSVANGFTHVNGLFKESDEENFKKILSLCNYFNNSYKFDIYEYMKNIIIENINKYNDDSVQYKKLLKNLENFLKTKNKLNSINIVELKQIFELVSNMKDILITRKIIKKPLMTILYSSKFRTWHKDINDILFIEYYENSVELVKNENFLKLASYFDEKDNNFIFTTKFLGYAVTSLFNLNKNEIPLLKKITDFLILFEDRLGNVLLENEIEDVRFYINDEYYFSLYYYEENDGQEFKLNSFESKERISFKEQKYITLDINKILSASIPNIIHSCDGNHCLNILSNMLENEFICISIHDCFIIPWYSEKKFRQIYNETYYNYYTNKNIYNSIYYIKQSKKYLLIDNVENYTKNHVELWEKYKDYILKSNFNLSFE